MSFYRVVISLKDADGIMANSENPDKTAQERSDQELFSRETQIITERA